MPAQLLSLAEGPSILLDKPILLLGRHAECDIQLNSRKVSRKHCCIAQVKDYLVIRDLDSTNGVRVNGTRVKEGVLRSGDELTIGNFRYQIHTEPARESLAPARPAARKPQPSDDMLESSDEPVPLPEASGVQAPPARKARESSLRLPDNISLQPAEHPSSLAPPPISPPPV
jgi:pSer/pThr/pTyr-binding forkhead associated (FHA) protein